MSQNPHPQYKNPTILEAICDVFFRVPTSDKLRHIESDIYKKVGDQYPTFKAVPSPIPTIVISNVGDPPSPHPQIIRYISDDEASMLQLIQESANAQEFKGHIVVNLRRYLGWEDFQAKIKYALERAWEVIEPEAVLRIGLRYINKFERISPDETLSEWLKPSKYIAEEILHSKKGFAQQLQVKPTDNEWRVITIAETLDEISPAYIFDIDSGIQNEMSVDVDSILRETNRLHEDVWNIFNSSTGDKLGQLLRGEPE